MEIHISKRLMEIHTPSMDGESMCSQKAPEVITQSKERIINHSDYELSENRKPIQ